MIEKQHKKQQSLKPHEEPRKASSEASTRRRRCRLPQPLYARTYVAIQHPHNGLRKKHAHVQGLTTISFLKKWF